jgi:hypothetical protein
MWVSVVGAVVRNIALMPSPPFTYTRRRVFKPVGGTCEKKK